MRIALQTAETRQEEMWNMGAEGRKREKKSPSLRQQKSATIRDPPSL